MVLNRPSFTGVVALWSQLIPEPMVLASISRAASSAESALARLGLVPGTLTWPVMVVAAQLDATGIAFPGGTPAPISLPSHTPVPSPPSPRSTGPVDARTLS
ncbi:MAG: hypothetical protein M3083_21235 [Actinomycetota bacterium]|nr:hypothetical protein [Actinomycetota bacterium]